MDIVILVGPQAVGKMTVGEELERQTGLKLLHNHMTIDLVLRFMSWDQGIDLILQIREEIMKRVAKYQSIPGMIITFIWAFNQQEDWDYVAHIVDIFKGHNVYFVELNSQLETRLARNVTENRLAKKWTKQDIEWSNNEVKASMKKHRMTSFEGEVPYQPYLRIHNETLSVKETADLIIDTFALTRINRP